MIEHSANAAHVLTYLDAKYIVCPTQFQADTYPATLQPAIRVIHEGVDTAIASPDRRMRFSLANGVELNASTPMRGFHIFMRSLPKLLSAVDNAQVVLIGHDGTDSYGPPHASGSWKNALLEEVGPELDLNRVHFVGTLPYEAMCSVLASSTAHVHFSYPSILSWSLLDAMACGSLVIGSNTASISEVVKDGHNGVLVDFFDVDALSSALIAACRNPDQFRTLRENARATVVNEFDRATICEPAWTRLIGETLGD